MDYNIKELYKCTMSDLMNEYYGGAIQTTCAYSAYYGVAIERTRNFTILWDGRNIMTMLAVYDWNNHIALDLSDGVDGFSSERKINK